MKRCTYCGKEYSDDISQCLVDGQPVEGPGETIAAAVLEQPPIIASFLTMPRLGSKLSDRQLRIIEICIVCSVAFGASILASFYIWWNPSGYPSSSGPFRWIYSIVRAGFALVLLWYVLLRRSKGFSDIGLSWKGKSDFGWSIIISVAGSFAFNILYEAIYYSGLTSSSRAETSSHVGHLLFSGGIAFATIAYQFVNPFFEELIVRTYVMTAVQKLTKNKNKIDYVIVTNYDRITRNFFEGLAFMKKLEQKWKVKLISVI